MTKLIVYSDVILLSGFKRWAAHHPEPLFFAKNAAKAIEIIEQHSIDFVVSELTLMDMDAIELMAQLSDLRPTLKMAFFLPANYDIDHEQLSLLHSLYFIHQPVSLKEFIHFVSVTVLGIAAFQTLPIAQIKIIDFLKLIHYQHKTCLLEIHHLDSNQSFQLYFEMGILYNVIDVTIDSAYAMIQSAYVSADFNVICAEFETSSMMKQLLQWKRIKFYFRPMHNNPRCYRAHQHLHHFIR